MQLREAASEEQLCSGPYVPLPSMWGYVGSLMSAHTPGTLSMDVDIHHLQISLEVSEKYLLHCRFKQCYK